MQNVNFAELTGIERILNVLLRKKKKKKRKNRVEKSLKKNQSHHLFPLYIFFFFNSKRIQVKDTVYMNIFLYIVFNLCLFIYLETHTNQFQ